MNTKTLLAGLVGGVAAFFLGWLVYGMALDAYMRENTNQCAAIDMKDMNMALMIIANLLSGMVMALILSWANVKSFMDGLMKGALVGLLYGLTFDLMMHSMSTYFNNSTAMVVDVVAGTAMSAIVGGVVGWMLGRGSTSEA
jgi:uncharacterized membrane protein